jgi:ribosomal protein S18 acetylase RimI-like enzyme
MTRYAIRPATARDASGVRETVRAAYAPYRESGLDLPPVEEGLEKAIAETPVLVAKLGGTILGAIVLRVGPDALHVENLAVHPRASGRGVAKSLLAEAETLARQRGLAELRLATHKDLTRTIAVYDRLGWAVTERSGLKVMMRKPVSVG